jgi:hypothetical protein
MKLALVTLGIQDAASSSAALATTPHPCGLAEAGSLTARPEAYVQGHGR